MMKKWLLAFVLATGFTATAFAETAEPARNPEHLRVVEADLKSVFASDEIQKMDIVTLSQKEMQETEGAWIWMAYYAAPVISSYALMAYNSAAYLPAYHAAHFLGFWRR